MIAARRALARVKTLFLLSCCQLVVSHEAICLFAGTPCVPCACSHTYRQHRNAQHHRASDQSLGESFHFKQPVAHRQHQHRHPGHQLQRCRCAGLHGWPAPRSPWKTPLPSSRRLSRWLRVGALAFAFAALSVFSSLLSQYVYIHVRALYTTLRIVVVEIAQRSCNDLSILPKNRQNSNCNCRVRIGRRGRQLRPLVTGLAGGDVS